MSKRSGDQLFKLVKSLTKAEKRNFKIYATRQQSGEDILFVQLFDQIDQLSRCRATARKRCHVRPGGVKSR